MQKKTLYTILGVVLLCGLITLLPKTGINARLMRLLNEDHLYLKNGEVVRGWVWDDRDGVVVGETADKAIFIFSRSEYSDIKKNKLLQYLREFI
jgi:hypothetical protein